MIDRDRRGQIREAIKYIIALWIESCAERVIRILFLAHRNYLTILMRSLHLLKAASIPQSTLNRNSDATTIYYLHLIVILICILPNTVRRCCFGPSRWFTGWNWRLTGDYHFEENRTKSSCLQTPIYRSIPYPIKLNQPGHVMLSTMGLSTCHSSHKPSQSQPQSCLPALSMCALCG